MIWVEFIFSAAVIVFAATQLAKYGDIIAVRTRLGGMFIGILLLAGATSLPEVLTTVSSLSQGVPNLAAGSLLGSNMFNMVMLAVIDLTGQQRRILRKAALKHALSGSLAAMLIAMVVFFILAKTEIQVGWVGLDSILLMLAYAVAIYLIQQNANPLAAVEIFIPERFPSLRRGILGFLAAAGVLAVITPVMVRSSVSIAEVTGLGASFVGTTLVALVTSLPEMVTTLAALKLGADDMAIGNLFGSNLFNMFALGLTDVFFVQGRFLSLIDPAFLLVSVIGLIMTILALIGNLARIERRLWFLEVDALALILVYVGGLWLLYSRGM
ncbi:MAG: sodium:calcium antiporter [Anaerolineaceae bacterium]|nr:sodium:calcium antiporter [Anaerolineaceae bacterium]